VLGCLACVQLFFALRLRAWKELLVSTWLAIAVPLFLVFVLRSIARHVQAYAAPPVFFCLVNAVPWQGRFRLSRRWSLGLLAGVLALFPARLWQLHLDNGALARSPSPTAAEDKRTIVALAERLAPFGEGARWGVFAGPYGEKVDLECFHRFGVLLDSRVSLTPHEPDWRADYPRMNPRRIAGRLMAEAEDGIEIAVVFQDPQRAWQGTQLHNWISQRVAALMSREIPKRWEHIFSVPSSTVGDLAGYRNPRAATAPARRSPASP
jgi:hypothetical protein